MASFEVDSSSRADGNAGLRGDFAHRRCIEAALAEDAEGRSEDALPGGFGFRGECRDFMAIKPLLRLLSGRAPLPEQRE